MASKELVRFESIYESGKSNAALILKIKNDFITDSSDLNIKVFTDCDNPSHTTLIASKNDTYYTGKCENSLGQNYLMIVNRKKRKARLLSFNVCNLSQVKTKSDETNLQDIGEINRKRVLTDKFGSKKSKRKMELNRKMIVNAEACEEQLKPILEETIIDESYFDDICDGTQSLEKLLPPCERNASSPQQVYNMNGLISNNEKESLKEAAEIFIENPPEEGSENPSVSRFLLMHFKMLSTSISMDSVILLLYADTLIRLLEAHPKTLKNRDAWYKISPYSKLIISKVKKEFTDSKVVTPLMRHKLACHALVAILLACNYRIHFDKISCLFSGINTQKLQQLCSLVGATPASRVAGDVLTLKVPLPPIPIARSPKKKKI